MNVVDDLPELNRPQPWMSDALCREYPHDMFFPPGEDNTSNGRRRSSSSRVIAVDAAKAVCRRCAVRVECLTYAIESDEPAGIWGGRTVDERRALRNHMLKIQEIAT